MAYNSNIPQPADQLKNSQPQLLANFQEINTALNVNHVGFNVADEGKHKFLQMPQQGGAPVTGATELALFALQGAISGNPELNFKRQGNPLTSIPFTEGLLAGNGWTILPCGLVVKWGSSVLAGAGAVSQVSWNFAFPTVGFRAFTQPPFLVLLTPSRNTAPRLYVQPFWDYAQTTATTLYGYTDNISGLIGTPIPSYTIQYVAIGI